MRIAHWMLATSCASLLMAVAPTTGQAQFGSIAKKAEEAARKKAEADRRKAAADSANRAAAQAPAPAAGPAEAKPAPGAAPDQPNADPKVWENYDFIPGNKVLFYTDFSEDIVGNFARGLKFKAGSMDVVERDGVKMLRSTSRGEFLVPVGRKLPERFTLEVDVIAPPVAVGGYDLIAFEGGSTWDRDEASAELNWNAGGTAIIGGGQNIGVSQYYFPDAVSARQRGQVVHLRVLVDGTYLKFYSNERRVYNIPELGFKRDSVIRFLLKGSEEPNLAAYISMIRLAESETDVLYDALAAKGRWATQGILFETGRSNLKPESRPVLKEIAATMQKYPDLKLLIEGHTDNVGSAATNLTLSDARAAAVRAALVSEFGIAGERLTTKGLGDTKPAVPNSTPAGRAQNRRVELVKQ
jgi:outer membrane protein OmpA-like peptidoglycan-associated protein